MSRLRRAALARLIAAGGCWSLFLLDLGGYLTYHPSGRGPTPFQQVGHLILLPGMFLLGSLFTVTAFVHAARYARARTRVGVGAGRCWRCGYDVHATPTRCPECGTPPTHEEHGHSAP